MSYFEEQYRAFSYPIETTETSGFRPAQLAAIHAVNAHLYSKPKQPGIVVMPTGSGKTTIINALCFTQRAKRVLIITPSRLVREQIAEGFESLSDLIQIGAVPASIPRPKVLSTTSRIQTITDWQALYQYDVVVATVPSINPGTKSSSPIPDDLFDLVLVDEAHHSPARTWSQVLKLCSSAKQVLFTATPFRRDDKEIKGKFVFTYDLRRAHEDGVFGNIDFFPVQETSDADIDIAKRTEHQFNQDRSDGLSHLVMVRTDSIKRAQALKAIYDGHTNLRLALVKGQHSLRHVKSVVDKLRHNQLDGIVCVNMFGEGFNLPQLKIAAVHSPHKSLAITLQFIGRFARTSGTNIGRASFIAAPQDSNNEIQGLYEAGSVWKDIVSNLSEGRIGAELEIREVLESFQINAHADLDDFSMYSLCPYFHVKVFQASEDIDLYARPDFPEKLEVVFEGRSEEQGAAVYLAREVNRCVWSKDERFNNVSYDLFIFHHNADAGLLFICSSRRNPNLYDQMATPILGEHPQPLAHSEINRALNDLEAAEFFSVGMRKRHRLGQTESYRMLAGPNADRAILETDGRLFDRGHCFGKGLHDGQEVTLGVSSGSKVWSNTYDRIPSLLAWCDEIAGRINSGREPKTGSRLDHLAVGERLREVPGGIIAMAWHRDCYLDPVSVTWNDEYGEVFESSILTFDCNIEHSQTGRVQFTVNNGRRCWRGVFKVGNGRLIQALDEDQPSLTIKQRNLDVSIADFLNEKLPTFYVNDLSSIEGNTIFRSRHESALLSEERFEAVDWAEAGVSMTLEKPDGTDRVSIFAWLESRLLSGSGTVVFCDDGSGEIADFIEMLEEDGRLTIRLYHCKASKEAAAGNRVDDVYDVCGQAIKCSVWFRQALLLKQLSHRSTLNSVRGFIRGDLEEMRRLLSREDRQKIDFEVYIVQPGIKKDRRSSAISHILAGVANYLHDGGASAFLVISS